jgi:hypothetical protein
MCRITNNQPGKKRKTKGADYDEGCGQDREYQMKEDMTGR